MTEQLIERATLLFEQQRYQDAQKGIMEVLAIEPENINCLMMLAEINIHNEEFDEALKIVDNAIGIAPDYDVLYYTKARVLISLKKSDEALKYIREAISIDPYDADNHALLGFIQNYKKNFEEALSAANQALEIDSSHVFALNVRSTALLKLNRKDDSYETIEGALHENPNDAYTHTNYGWGLLEKGNTDKALEHFREALRNDPNSEYAQSGMAEALKSKHLIYRWFLKYSFWMNNLASKNQWIFIIGFYFASKFLRTIAKNSPGLAPFLTPIIILMAVFAFSTWVMAPLSNLLFRLNKFGKHLLSSEEIKSSNLVGISLLVLFAGLVLLLVNQNLGAAIAIYGFTMMVPLSNQFQKPAYFFSSYGIGMAILGISAIVSVVQSGELFTPLSSIYLLAFISYQWISNYFMIKRE